MLSTKLINAINHSTMLDDSLQQTRHELEAAREKLARLEAQVKEHEEKISKGLLVDKEIYDKMEKQYTSDVQDERNRRIAAETSKRKTDGEVEALTAALFEEANVVSRPVSISRNNLLTYRRWLQLPAKRPKLQRNVANTTNNNSPMLKYFSNPFKSN